MVERFWGTIDRETAERFIAKYPGLPLNAWIKQKIDEDLNNANLQDKTINNSEKELKIELLQKRIVGIDLDNEIKRRKLTYMQTFGAEPSREAMQAIETGIRQKQVVWQGSGYKPNQKIESLIYGDNAQPEITDAEWQLVFPCMAEFDDNDKRYRCVKCNMNVGETVNTTRQHLMNEHEDLVLNNLKFLKS